MRGKMPYVGRRGRRQTAIGRVLERATTEGQAMATIREMLAAGAEAAPVGARTTLRLPGDPRTKEFPSDLVERVRRELRDAG